MQSFWAASQARGPARHMYELTPAGRQDLAGCADDIDELISHLTGFLSRFNGARPENDEPPAPAPDKPEGAGQLKTRRRFRKPG